MDFHVGKKVGPNFLAWFIGFNGFNKRTHLDRCACPRRSLWSGDVPYLCIIYLIFGKEGVDVFSLWWHFSCDEFDKLACFEGQRS